MESFKLISLENNLCGLSQKLDRNLLYNPGSGQINANSFYDKNIDPSSMANVIFGYRIPWLIDFMSDPAYKGHSHETTIQNILTLWTKSLYSLWSNSLSALSIRLLWDPNSGKVDIAILCRATGIINEINQISNGIARNISTLTRSLQLPFEILKSEREIISFLFVDNHHYINEIRQKEALLPIEFPASGEIHHGYVIYPYASPAGTWVDIFRAITNQSSKLLINLHIQPTILTDIEIGLINRAAQISKELIDFKYDGFYRTEQVKNHNATVAYRIYSFLANRLDKPFLATAQVAGNDISAVNSLSHLLGAAFTVSPIMPAEIQEQELRSAYQVVSPTNNQTYRQSLTTLHHLWLTDWGTTEASNGLERLRYLVDARGAAALFRFPIPSETGLPGIKVRKIEQGYETGQKVSTLPDGHVLLGHQENGGIQSIPIKDFSRHGIICGLPGSGKTNTTLSILVQLWRDHQIPFWVFEPPKTEYRGLMSLKGFEDLLIFTLGDESTAPLRLNPFELLPGVRVEEHINNLKTCFEAGLPKIDESGSLLPMFLDAATRNIYKKRGWKFMDKSIPNRELPTLHDLYIAAQAALNGYAGEVKQNLTTAVNNRINSLLRGSKGRMFNIEKGVSVSDLLSRPVIFELLPMGQDAPLAIMFLLTFLRENAQRRSHGNLQHVTVIEEAHVIMSRPESGIRAGNAASGVSDAFERILAELRSTGEGVIIAEQSPTKLIKGAIDLTNFKIAHRLSSLEEVKAIGGSMIASDIQQESIQRLTVGKAALFMDGLQGLSFIQSPNFKEENNFEERLQEEAVEKHMENFYKTHPEFKLPFTGCALCRSQCNFRWDIESIAIDDILQSRLIAAGREKDKAQGNQEQATRIFYELLFQGAEKSGLTKEVEAAWCYWVQTSDIIDEDLILHRKHRREFDRWASIINN